MKQLIVDCTQKIVHGASCSEQVLRRSCMQATKQASQHSSAWLPCADFVGRFRGVLTFDPEGRLAMVNDPLDPERLLAEAPARG